MIRYLGGEFPCARYSTFSSFPKVVFLCSTLFFLHLLFDRWSI